MADSPSLIALNEKILEVETLLAKTLMSDDGSNISADTYWVTEIVYEALIEALDDALVIRDESSSTDADYDNVNNYLTNAVDAFIDARQLGTLVADSKPPIDPKDSILTSVKKLLGIQEEDESFDVELILDINSVFMILNQLGLGPVGGFFIEDKKDTWPDFLNDRDDLNAVKSYVYLKVRLIFDPPQMGYLVESINKQCQELEWRLNVQMETKTMSNEDEGG